MTFKSIDRVLFPNWVLFNRRKYSRGRVFDTRHITAQIVMYFTEADTGTISTVYWFIPFYAVKNRKWWRMMCERIGGKISWLESMHWSIQSNQISSFYRCTFIERGKQSGTIYWEKWNFKLNHNFMSDTDQRLIFFFFIGRIVRFWNENFGKKFTQTDAMRNVKWFYFTFVG